MAALYLFILVCFLLWIAYKDCSHVPSEPTQEPAQAIPCVPVSFRAEKRGRALWSVATLPGGAEIWSVIWKERA